MAKNNKKISTKVLKKGERIYRAIYSFFWFFVGFIFSAILIVSFILIYFQTQYKNRVIPGVYIDNIYVGEKTGEEIEKILNDKNNLAQQTKIILTGQNYTATLSAKDLDIGYNTQLLEDQAMTLGKSSDITSNLYIISSSYINNVYLPLSYTYSKEKLMQKISDYQTKIYAEPVEALFNISSGRVSAFKESKEGQTVDFEKLSQDVENQIPNIINNPKKIFIKIPIKILKPKMTTEKVNSFGIVELLAEGKSSFNGSITNRIHNINLATSKFNGILVAPNETFSFDKYLGDVSKETGYKEAYIIKDGKTILGDGGGVCQVSTTLFRALLNAGLPITERHAHAYRVGYYEQDSAPGLDATVFYPSVDLKFKNDTGNYILVQGNVDNDGLTMTFNLYGKKDNREVNITKPIISSQTPPKPPLYQDDPTLQKGIVKQVDYEAWGAKVNFSRTVSKNGKVIISENYVSNYLPWQSIFLKGTKD